MTTKVFISYDEFSSEEFYDYIEQNPTHKIVLWVPEASIIPQLYKTAEEWISFSQNLDSKNIDYTLVTSDSEFYGVHPNVIGWDDFAAYKIMYDFKIGSISFSKRPQMALRHFVTRFGRESFQCSIIVDLLHKYKLENYTTIQYDNYGNDFLFNKDYSPSFWDGNLFSNIANNSLNEYNIPSSFIFSAIDISATTDIMSNSIQPSMLYPIMNGFPSVVYGKKGIVKKMERVLGISMYNDMIDTSYDSIQDSHERADSLLGELRTLFNTYNDPEIIVKKFDGNAIFNKQKVFNLVKNKNVNEKIKEFLDIPELHYYKEILNSSDNLTMIGNIIYQSS
jgi:hypothetical protein